MTEITAEMIANYRAIMDGTKHGAIDDISPADQRDVLAWLASRLGRGIDALERRQLNAKQAHQ